MELYSNHEFAMAFLAASKEGVSASHYVVVNPLHFLELFMAGDIVCSGDSCYKITTGKKVWFYNPESE